MPPTQILISAGEASGDMYAARLATALRARVDVQLFGMGGPRMREAGVELVADCSEVSLVGIVEIAKKYPALNRVWKRLLGEAARRKPRLAILTDFPGFHLRLARALKHQDVPNVYFVCPQFWAWRPWRANLVRRRFVRGLCIFPFEAGVVSLARREGRLHRPSARRKRGGHEDARGIRRRLWPGREQTNRGAPARKPFRRNRASHAHPDAGLPPDPEGSRRAICAGACAGHEAVPDCAVSVLRCADARGGRRHLRRPGRGGPVHCLQRHRNRRSRPDGRAHDRRLSPRAR